jgi:hypothetical protein
MLRKLDTKRMNGEGAMAICLQGAHGNIHIKVKMNSGHDDRIR